MTAAPTDPQLVAGVLAGDRAAFAQVYDRYADRLHDFAYSMLRHREDAADAVADAFVTAAERLDQLRDPERLRPWLYSVVRRECLRRLKARSRTAYGADEQLAEMPDQAAAPDTLAEQESLRTLVWDAAAGLGERDRAMLDLHLRQGLDGAELGEAMGMSAANAYVGLSRLRDQVERSLGALLVARTSRADCADLDGVLDDWDGEFSPLVRKRVARHVDRCGACTRRRAALASPAALLGGVPVFAAPALLRDRVLEDTRLVSALASRSGPGGGPPGPGPGTAGRPGGRRDGRRTRRLAALLALLLLLVAIGWWQLDGDDARTVAEDPVAADVPPSPSAAPTGDPAPTPTPTPEASQEASPTEAATSDAPTASEEPTPEPSVEPSTDEPSDSPPPTPGRLSVSPRSLDLGPAGRGTVTVTNTGGAPLPYDVVVDDPWLSATPVSGTLQPGQSRSLSVSADRGGLAEGTSSGRVRVTSPRGSLPVAVTAARETPPTIGQPSVVRSACTANGRSLTFTVPVYDESGVASAAVSWRGPGASGTTALRPTGTLWAASIGPFPAGGAVQLAFSATDTRGNQGRRAATLSVDPCPQ